MFDGHDLARGLLDGLVDDPERATAQFFQHLVPIRQRVSVFGVAPDLKGHGLCRPGLVRRFRVEGDHGHGGGRRPLLFDRCLFPIRQFYTREFSGMLIGGEFRFRKV